MIRLEHVDKRFQQHHALKDVSLDFPENQTTVIIGPSGSGKSTLLRAINLLEHPETGHLKFDDLDVDFSKPLTNKVKFAVRRKSGMVFQNWNLFPHLTVLENITEGPRVVLHQSKAKSEQRAQELLKLVGLPDTGKRYPNQLSGGQQQRISICRALAMDPEYILLDEPTSALDPELETQVLRVLKDLAAQHQAMIVVTHNMDFARLVADRIVFFEDGEVLYDGAAKAFFAAPSGRIKQFLEAITLG
ncbi:amino acid ABC transporter ATP-binding protein [Agrilactobacillus fermenti]|uniref:amino acid ABC transporter ATP-binding protein n=1 Tax=Agrilactobacillus fermenti TaxID=2586909 RepID=UPI001E2BF1A5|nr:amino acid ABC transporter ATP-binding protein [Agrilactobacillus fermenti]MCD2256276.1 amino acid ABC transporter ATP-binding protein [Agrilactobacillus fermenti]